MAGRCTDRWRPSVHLMIRTHVLGSRGSLPRHGSPERCLRRADHAPAREVSSTPFCHPWRTFRRGPGPPRLRPEHPSGTDIAHHVERFRALFRLPPSHGEDDATPTSPRLAARWISTGHRGDQRQQDFAQPGHRVDGDRAGRCALEWVATLRDRQVIARSSCPPTRDHLPSTGVSAPGPGVCRVRTGDRCTSFTMRVTTCEDMAHHVDVRVSWHHPPRLLGSL